MDIDIQTIATTVEGYRYFLLSGFRKKIQHPVSFENGKDKNLLTIPI